MIEIIEVCPKAYRQIGSAKICADKIAPKDDAILLGKNLNNFEIGFDKIIMPTTTLNDNWKPTHNSCVGDINRIIIQAKDSAEIPSYL